MTFYECGNELTRDRAIIIDSTNAGTKALDFNNGNWPLMCGAMRGMIDGVKAAQPGAKCGINFCVADVGAIWSLPNRRTTQFRVVPDAVAVTINEMKAPFPLDDTGPSKQGHTTLR